MNHWRRVASGLINSSVRTPQKNYMEGFKPFFTLSEGAIHMLNRSKHPICKKRLQFRTRFSTKSSGEISGGGGGGGGKGGDRTGGGGGHFGGSGGSPMGWIGGIWAAYLKQLDTRPLITKMWTSGVLNGFGDVASQLGIERETPFDTKRFCIFTFLGIALVGPVLHQWYGILSRVFPAPGFASAIKSLALDQFLFAPMFCGLFLSSLLTLEGKPREIPGKLKQDLVAVVVMNWKIWIPAQLFNFSVVPPNLRVLCANITALVWNTYLSFASHLAVSDAESDVLVMEDPSKKKKRT